MIYLNLFYEFFKTGLFAVGGGLATLPFLYDMADRTGWFSSSQLADMLAVSESTPGPIGVNMATYVGFTIRGIPGALVATLGLVTPSVIVILIVAAFLKSFRDNRFVNAGFYGLRPASTAMVASAGISVVALALLQVDQFHATGALADLINWKGVALAAVLLVLTRWVKPTKGLHPILFILASAVVGVVFQF
ncbi:MAG: chromate transporter [Oscillibacter sp.]|nr:chromate transporter [Oscillibacter sp.]